MAFLVSPLLRAAVIIVANQGRMVMDNGVLRGSW